MKRAIIVLSIVSIMAGCSSVPISTMWRMKDFSDQDLAEIDPNELRVRVVHPVYMAFDLKNSHFEVGFVDDKGGNDEYAFGFKLLERLEIKQGMFRKKFVGQTTLGLSSKGIDGFVRLQNDLKNHQDNSRKAGFNVLANFGATEDWDKSKEWKNPKILELSILLKLAAEEEYFTLIDNARIELKDNKGDIK